MEIQDVHRHEIKEYLDLLDLTVDIESRWMSDFNRKEMRTVFSLPGIRYSQVEALIKSLMQDDVMYINVEEYLKIHKRDKLENPTLCVKKSFFAYYNICVGMHGRRKMS